MLRKYRIQNFKAFSEPASISIKPLTLIYGPNSAGKSSIIQSLMMLKQTLEDANSTDTVLRPKGKLVDLGNFSEFIHLHETQRSFSVSVEVDGDTSQLSSENPYSQPTDLINDKLYKELYNQLTQNPYLSLELIFNRNENTKNICLDRIIFGLGKDLKPIATYVRTGRTFKIQGFCKDHDFWKTWWKEHRKDIENIFFHQINIYLKKLKLEEVKTQDRTTAHIILQRYRLIINEYKKDFENTAEILEKSLQEYLNELETIDHKTAIIESQQINKDPEYIENKTKITKLERKLKFLGLEVKYIGKDFRIYIDGSWNLRTFKDPLELLDNKLSDYSNEQIAILFPYTEEKEKEKSIEERHNQEKEIYFKRKAQIQTKKIYLNDRINECSNEIYESDGQIEILDRLIELCKRFTNYDYHKAISDYEIVCQTINVHTANFLPIDWEESEQVSIDWDEPNQADEQSTFNDQEFKEYFWSSVYEGLAVANLLLDSTCYTGKIIQDNITSCNYLGPQTEPLERIYFFSGNNVKNVGKTGKFVPNLLLQNPERVQKVDEYLEKFELGYRLKIIHFKESEMAETQDMYAIRLFDKYFKVNVSPQDAGSGTSQILPIIVQSLFSEDETIIIEQPESHIHPRLQTELVSLFFESTQILKNRFIIETHSEHLILKLKKLIQQGKLNHNDVSIIYVKRNENSSECVPLKLDSEGNFVDDLNQSFFEEDFKKEFNSLYIPGDTQSNHKISKKEYLISIFKTSKKFKFIDRHIGASMIDEDIETGKIQLSPNYKKIINNTIEFSIRALEINNYGASIDFCFGIKFDDFKEENQSKIHSLFKDFFEEVKARFSILISNLEIRMEKAEKYNFDIYPKIISGNNSEPILYKKTTKNNKFIHRYSRYIVTEKIELLFENQFDSIISSKDWKLNSGDLIRKISICKENLGVNKNESIDSATKKLKLFAEDEYKRCDARKNILLYSANSDVEIDKFSETNKHILWIKEQFEDNEDILFKIQAKRYEQIWQQKENDFLNSKKSEIIHFIDFNSDEEVVLKNSFYNSYEVNENEPINPFSFFPTIGVKCVILDSCYQEHQARQLAEYVPFVIGIPQNMELAFIQQFIKVFYSALTDDCNYEDAFIESLRSLNSKLRPQLLITSKVTPDKPIFISPQHDNQAKPMTSLEQSKLNVFLSYSHKDEDLLNKLLPHLATLKRQEFINTWHDRQISGGTEWAKAIENNLADADIILLLVSSDFIASDYCWAIELKQAIKRHEAGTARVIPIILRACDWSGTPFSKFQGFPKNAKPVLSYSQQDEAFTEIAKGIRKVVDEIITQKQLTVSTNPSASQPPSQATEPSIGLWVHGWEKQSFEHPPHQTIIELPWQGHFNRKPRQVPDLQSWLNTLEPELEQTKATLLQDHKTKYLDIRGQLPLSYSLAIGATFPRVGGFQLRTQQNFPDQPPQLWHSHSERSELTFKTVAEDGLKGDHLLVAFGISGSLEKDVKNWQMSDPVAFSAEIYLEPENGAGRSSLQSEGDAIALAIAASETITQLKEKYAAIHTHIILRAPAGFALFLGQQLNAVGTVTVYEWTSARGYTPAVQLQTG